MAPKTDKSTSYVQTLIEIKDQLSFKYYQNQEQLKKELQRIRKEFGIKSGELMKLPL